MNLLRLWVAKPLAVLIWVALLTYVWLNRANQIAEARLKIPPIQNLIREAEREQSRLLYAVDAFEHPLRLHRLLKDERYAHLHFPQLRDVIFLTHNAGERHRLMEPKHESRDE
jgi:hypothetical protein